MITIHYCVVQTNKGATSPYRQSLQFKGKGVFNDLFFPEGRGTLKGKKTFRGPEVWILNSFSGTKGGKMILCFLRCMMENSEQILQSELSVSLYNKCS